MRRLVIRGERFDAEAAARAYVDAERREPTPDEQLREEYRAFLAGEPLQAVVQVATVQRFHDADGALRSVIEELTLECGHTQLGAATPTSGTAASGRCARCWRARQAQRQADQVGMF